MTARAIWGRRIRLPPAFGDPCVHLVDPLFNHTTQQFPGGYHTCCGYLDETWFPWEPSCLPHTVPITCFRCLQREAETRHKWDHGA